MGLATSLGLSIYKFVGVCVCERTKDEERRRIEEKRMKERRRREGKKKAGPRF